MIRRLSAAVSLAALLVVSLGSAAGAQPEGLQESERFADYATASELSEDHADVFRLYWAFFDRQPDVSGAHYWVEEYNACASLLDIAWSFSHSTEFQRRYSDLTDSQYVWLVYRNVLDREPDPFGEAYWLELLNDGELTRPELMLYFSLSAEFRLRHPLPSDGRAFTGCADASADVEALP